MNWKNLDVIVLTYNRASYLKIMLDSLCTQTATGFNIKILNNASTDNTLQVIQEIKDKYPTRNIEVITHKTNIGNPANFKYSQKIAANQYTAVFHDDDAIHPEYIDTAMTLLTRHPEAVLCSSSLDVLYNVSNTNWNLLNKQYDLYPQNKGFFLELLNRRCSCAANVYKTVTYKAVEYHPEKYGKLHDIDIIWDLSLLGSIILLQGYGIRYRLHPNQDSNCLATGPFPEEIAAVIEHLQKLASAYPHIGVSFLTYTFARLLFEWSRISNMSWKYFRDKVLFPRLGKTYPYKLYNNKYISKLMKFLIRKVRNYYRRKTRREY